MNDAERSRAESGTQGPAVYEAPRVERALTAADLEREVVYAGAPVSIDRE
jgi:hypothetical protein